MKNKITNLLARLEQVNQKLINEHKKSRRQIQELMAEREEFLQEKKERHRFLAETSHAVSNSLTILRLNLEFIRPKISKQDFKIVEDELSLIAKTLSQLTQVVEIEIPRLSSAQKINLSVLAKQILRVQVSKNHFWEVDIKPNVFIVGFEKEIILLIENLLENAQKYTAKNKKISFSCCQKGRDVLLVVSDEGSGIPKAELGKIFQEFWRSPSQKLKKRGSGLGLNIVKKIIKKHKGQIEVKSNLGKGSSFIVIFPAINKSSSY